MDGIQMLRCIGAYGYSASRKVTKDPKNTLRFSYLTLYDSPKRLSSTDCQNRLSNQKVVTTWRVND